jgi:hypothetical protein
MIPAPGQNPTGENTQAETRRQQQQIQNLEQDIHKGEKWLIILTAAMAFFALCGVIVGILQWRTYSGQLGVMRSTLEEMHNSGQVVTDQANKIIGNINWLAREMNYARDQSRDLARSSERNAKAALDASIAIAHSEQRAWIVVPDKYRVVDLLVGGRISYSIAFVNIGKTPASEVKAIVRAQIIPTGKQPAFTYPPGTSHEFAIGELVPNNDEPHQLEVRDAHAPVVLTADGMKRIQGGLDYIAIYAAMTYRDIVGWHWMRFCRQVYTGPSNKGQVPENCGRYNASGDGNTFPEFQ